MIIYEVAVKPRPPHRDSNKSKSRIDEHSLAPANNGEQNIMAEQANPPLKYPLFPDLLMNRGGTFSF